MIRFYVDEQSINLKVSRTIASDTINFVKLEFVFCESWKGYNKTVQFTQCTNTYSINLGIEGTSCYLPNEITDGLCAISVFGIYNDKRATTVPYQVRINRSGFMENSIIPSDTPISVYEQMIQDIDKLKSEVDYLKNNLAIVSTSNPNRLVEGFDLQFGNGYETSGIAINYDKNTNTLTLNGRASEDVKIGLIKASKKVYINMGCYEFVNCEDGNIFENGNTSALPFELVFNAAVNDNRFIGDYAIITNRAVAAAAGNSGTNYNKIKRDCFGTMAISIKAGTTFNNETFHPYLIRYSAYVE